MDGYNDMPPLVSPPGGFSGEMCSAGPGSTPFMPPPRTSLPGGWGHSGPTNGFGAGQFQDADEPWGSQGGFATGYPGDTSSTINGFPHANPATGSYPPSTSFAPPNGYDTSYYNPIRQQTMSTPPAGAYMQPSWVANMGAAPLAQQSSPWDSMALTRPSSMSMAGSGLYNPHGPSGFDSYSPASTLGQSPKSGYGHDGGLPDRPSEWRKDFSMRSGLSSLLPRQRRQSSYGDHSTHPRSHLHPFIRHTFNDPPVAYDLRLHPSTLSFREVHRDILASDLTRFACEPPVPYMRLYHPRLPWYIDVHASNPTGVNLGDLFMSIWHSLRCPIQKSDFWNDELSESDRDKVSHAWRVRCNGDRMEHGRGVRRVDFLRRHVTFEGLVKGRNGMWEIKTSKVAYPG